jgi:hypothetical protein
MCQTHTYLPGAYGSKDCLRRITEPADQLRTRFTGTTNAQNKAVRSEIPEGACTRQAPQYLSAFLSVLQVAGPHLTGEDIADDARGHEARNLRRVVGR